MVRALGKHDFQHAITDHNTLVIDFWAPWCAPCRSFAPVFEEAAERHPDVDFAKVNTEEEPELASAFGIRSVPTLMVIREKVMLYSQPGALNAGDLDALIERVQALDMPQVHARIAEEEQKGGQGGSDREPDGSR